MALNSRIQTYQILTNDDEVYIPSLFSIAIAVTCLKSILFKKVFWLSLLQKNIYADSLEFSKVVFGH